MSLPGELVVARFRISYSRSTSTRGEWNMLRRLAVLGGLAAVMLTLAGVALAEHPGGGGTPFFATLTPQAECNATGTCNLGQPGASGQTEMRLNSGQEEICFTTEASGLATPVTGAHIHRAPPGRSGPIVVPFTPQAPGVGSGCVPASRELIKEIRQNPENFYVNVHTQAFPAGAIRGQMCGPGRGNC
jgi:hypothetical protein